MDSVKLDLPLGQLYVHSSESDHKILVALNQVFECTSFESYIKKTADRCIEGKIGFDLPQGLPLPTNNGGFTYGNMGGMQGDILKLNWFTTVTIKNITNQEVTLQFDFNFKR